MEIHSKTSNFLFRQDTMASLVDAMACSYKPAVGVNKAHPPLQRKRELSLDNGLHLGIHTSGKRSRALSSKSVSFVDDACNHVIPRSMCQEELSSVWYNRADYKSFRDDSRSLALAFELGILDRIHPEDFCLRGLEASLSSTNLEARLTARAHMMEVIFSTQAAQRGIGTRDAEMIRGLSLVLSKDACEDALKLADYDRLEAQNVFDEDKTNC